MGTSPSRSRNGQIFTVDLAASSVIFLVIVNLSLMTWTVAYQNKTMFTDERAMRNDVVRTSDLLVRTPGYPEDWNATNVRIAGFTQPDHVLDNDKLGAFGNIDYTRQQVVTRADPHDFHITVTVNGAVANVTTTVPRAGSDFVGEEPVAYIVESGQDLSRFALVDALNGSAVTWDLYWPSNNDEDLLGSLTARHVHNYTDQADELFDDMVQNASDGAYHTIVAENAAVDAGDIDEGALETWVSNGGTYLHTEESASMLRDTFGFNDVSTSNVGEVVTVPPLLNSSLEPGDTFQWAESVPMAFDDPDTIYVNDTNAPFGCHACRWGYDNGTVYYAADTFADAGFATTFTNASTAFVQPPPRNITLSFGRAPFANASTVVANERSVLVNSTDGLERGTLEVVFWE